MSRGTSREVPLFCITPLPGCAVAHFFGTKLSLNINFLLSFAPKPDLTMSDQDNYIIPARFRKMENTHILFWLVKDICWCIGIKWLGIAMIVPTLAIAGIIAWRTRHLISELTHNLAIFFWISANSFWMVTEFAHVDDRLKLYALIPFFAGVVPLVYYYAYYSPRQYLRNKAEMKNSDHRVLSMNPPVADANTGNVARG